MQCRIKENAWMARIAACKLRQNKVAMVWGNTILLHNTTEAAFLNNKRWLRHELAHVQQFKQHGFVWFLILYLIESIQHGYHNNKFEIAARAAEDDETIETNVVIRCIRK
jgi:hypothetical protein